MSWLTPKHVKDVQAFLGLANFYCRFIQDFSKIATPLNNLTRKETVWRWGEPSRRRFDELKRRFVEGPILVAADYTLPFTRGVWRFRFCNRSRIINAMWGWEVAPMCILSKGPKQCREKLWCAWQGDVGNNMSAWSVEALFGGGKAWNWRMDWSSKSQVLYDCQKVKLLTGTLGTVSLMI